MAERTFGWVQETYKIISLKRVLCYIFGITKYQQYVFPI